MRYSLLAEEIANIFYKDEYEGSRGSIDYLANVEALEDAIEDFMQDKLTLDE